MRCFLLAPHAPPDPAEDSHGRARVVSRVGVLFLYLSNKGCPYVNCVLIIVLYIDYVDTASVQVKRSKRSGRPTLLIALLPCASQQTRRRFKSRKTLVRAFFSGAIC